MMENVENFFEEIVKLLKELERQYGVANSGYTTLLCPRKIGVKYYCLYNCSRRSCGRLQARKLLSYIE